MRARAPCSYSASFIGMCVCVCVCVCCARAAKISCTVGVCVCVCVCVCTHTRTHTHITDFPEICCELQCAHALTLTGGGSGVGEEEEDVLGSRDDASVDHFNTISCTSSCPRVVSIHVRRGDNVPEQVLCVCVCVGR